MARDLVVLEGLVEEQTLTDTGVSVDRHGPRSIIVQW